MSWFLNENDLKKDFILIGFCSYAYSFFWEDEGASVDVKTH